MLFVLTHWSDRNRDIRATFGPDLNSALFFIAIVHCCVAIREEHNSFKFKKLILS